MESAFKVRHENALVYVERCMCSVRVARWYAHI